MAINTPEAPKITRKPGHGSIQETFPKNPVLFIPDYQRDANEFSWRTKIIENPDADPGEKLLAILGLRVRIMEIEKTSRRPLLPINLDEARKLAFKEP